MQRRTFFTSLAALGSVPLFSHPVQGASQKPPKISGVEVWRLKGKRESVSRGRQHQVQALHIYPEHRPKPFVESKEEKRSTVSASAYYLKILTDAGVEGIYGPIDREAAVVVDLQLKSFLMGKDALAGETLWDKLFRLNRHSRGGHFMMAISAVDNALWDLRGRYFQAPVYRLLGGPSREYVDAYGSCLGHSVEPDAARRRSIEFKQAGFKNQKWFLAYGPGDGPTGLKKNVELVRTLREAVGDEVDLMFDAYMGWDLNYAIGWAKQVEQYRPRWIEEAFHPDKIESFVRLRESTSIPVATGEHFYGRWQVNEYMKAGAISVIQADPEWCGGVSELVKICHVASLHDAHVIPHGHALHAALHVVASQSPMTCPMVEYLINKMQNNQYYYFEKNPLEPEMGRIRLPERPGFGIEFDETKIEDKAKMTWQT